MEIKTNKEIREYSESIYFGLSLRQFICSLLAVITAVSIFFLLRGTINTEILSWICIISVIPFACLGFVRFQGMHAEELFKEWFVSEFVLRRELNFTPQNLYYIAYEQWRKERKHKRTNDKNVTEDIKRR